MVMDVSTLKKKNASNMQHLTKKNISFQEHENSLDEWKHRKFCGKKKTALSTAKIGDTTVQMLRIPKEAKNGATAHEKSHDQPMIMTIANCGTPLSTAEKMKIVRENEQCTAKQFPYTQIET